MKKIKKILIANRGEIASRVIKTCDELGIKTVAIYAQDDRELPYVQEASQRVCLGAGPIAETYLNQEKIIEISQNTGCDAIHPGYGFLSENPEFAQRVLTKGMIFIGPNEKAIRLMGDKQASKQVLEKSQAPLVPGYHGDNQQLVFLSREADKIGYPILIKATSGGGGKGMRIVRNATEFEEALLAAKREAKKAFGSDKVLLEKYIENPRHIEVQVMGDDFGKVLHFYERECSIQRRYQKIIEETPSVALSHELRDQICQAAVRIAKAISYKNAGTVEFILAPDDRFYFLEMNTRLQVEHPVTEMVTGHDLVAIQIQVAQGEPLSLTQEQITQTGHSIECRIYAEDGDNNFMPSIGEIKKLGKSDRPGVRWDASYKEGNKVTINYDPMIAKLITYGHDRLSCLKKMEIALNEFYILGFKTNHNFLLRVLKNEDFIKGEVDTHFIEKNKEKLKRKPVSSGQLAQIIACYHLKKTNMKIKNLTNELISPWASLSDWRIDT